MLEKKTWLSAKLNTCRKNVLHYMQVNHNPLVLDRFAVTARKYGTPSILQPVT